VSATEHDEQLRFSVATDQHLDATVDDVIPAASLALSQDPQPWPRTIS
jgi:hypothetical protein